MTWEKILQARLFIPNELNNSAHYYTETESRSECISTVNEPYAETRLGREEEMQGIMRDARITDTLTNVWEDRFNIYMIDMSDQEEERIRENLTEEEDTTNMMFSNQDCKTLKKFMESEGEFTHDMKCDMCKKRDCDDCNLLKDRFSAEDSKVFKQLWENVRLGEKDGQTKEEVKYLYRNDPHETLLRTLT